MLKSLGLGFLFLSLCGCTTSSNLRPANLGATSFTSSRCLANEKDPHGVCVSSFKTSARENFFAEYLWANTHYPQMMEGFQLTLTATLLSRPMDIEELMAPITDAETHRMVEAMNQLHQAFHVPIRANRPEQNNSYRVIPVQAVRNVFTIARLHALGAVLRLVGGQTGALAGRTSSLNGALDAADTFPEPLIRFSKEILEPFYTDAKYSTARQAMQKLGQNVLEFTKSEKSLDVVRQYRRRIIEIMQMYPEAQTARDFHIVQARTAVRNTLSVQFAEILPRDFPISHRDAADLFQLICPRAQ